MRRLPFHILFSCILLPPVLYIFSLQALEVVAKEKWASELQEVLISDSKVLLQGHRRIEDEIQRNVETFLASCYVLKWGFRAQVLVKTSTGRRLYPSDTMYSFDSELFPRKRPVSQPMGTLKIAEENLNIMNEGIEIALTVEIPRNAWLANGILLFYIGIFTFLLYRAYVSSARAARQLAVSNQQALEAANKRLRAAQQKLLEVTDRESSYQGEIERLKTDLELASGKAKETENEALTEIEQLEKSLHESVILKEELEFEVLRLGEELESIESAQKIPPRKRRKQIDNVAKRFKTLYKNLDIQQRAIEGFLNLESDLQLRAESFIHSMNENSRDLPVKRKLFSKKGVPPTFECEFGYKGRIYWRPGTGTKTQILTIGTKNSQVRDLAYLENI